MTWYLSMKPEDFLPLNSRDFLILLALSEGERHGYGIVKDAEAQSGGQVYLDPANLYRALRRMLRDGLVKDLGEKAADSEGAPRRYYSLTALGRKVLSLEATRIARLSDEARARGLVRKEGRKHETT
jgi:DNA-binding PadR family transcriptional regulator